MSVVFTPTDNETYNTASADVKINVNAVISPQKTTPAITWTNPDNITFGTALSSTQLNAIARDPVSGNDVAGTWLYTPDIGTKLAEGQQQTLSVVFTPTYTETYNTASADVKINVNAVISPQKATPAITWTNPDNITVGTALSNTQLNAIARDPVNGNDVAGTWVYTPGIGTQLAEGQQQTLSVVFTPTDTETYNTAPANVKINVNAVISPQKTTPAITWTNPADIAYGTPLSSNQLDAVASTNGKTVPGNFIYDPAEGTVLDIGQHTVHVNFLPEDTASYTDASKDVTINVLNENYTIFNSIIGPDSSGDCIINSQGDNIPYRIVVKNEGDVNLTGVSVTDPMITLTGPTGDSLDPGVLNPGETWVYTGVYTLKPDDINNGNGFINNTATVSSNQLPDKSSTVSQPIAINAGLSIQKSVTKIDENGDYIINNPGDVIQYQVAVKNSGNIDLTGVSVIDPMITLTGPTGDNVDPGMLNPKETWIFTGEYTVTKEDIDSNGNGSGLIQNTATVRCNELPDKSSSMSLPIFRIPSIMVTPTTDNSKVTPVANFNTNIISGYAPLFVQFTDLSQNAAEWNWNFGDGAISTENNPAHTYSAAGTYTANLTVSNGSLTASKTAPITVLQVSGESSSGGSSSGGSGSWGADVSPEPQSNVEAKELSHTFISSGNSVNFTFPQNATPVVNISFDSKKTVGKTTTIVEMLKNQSTVVSESPSDGIYKFINIWVGNNGFATPSNIENAVVFFKVEKSWMQDKNINKSSITLNRYNSTKWNPLQTNLSGEDDKYLYFIAETPGFSHFAITGKAAANETVTETQSKPSSENLEQNNTSNAANVEQTQSPSTSGNGSTKSPGFEAVFGIVSLLTVFLYKRK